jgi:hypothetical protein
LLLTSLASCKQSIRLRSDDKREIIAHGLARAFNTYMLPDGEITILSALNAQLERFDPARRRYPPAFFTTLERLANAGFLTIQDFGETPPPGGFGTGFDRPITVVPSEKLRALADSTTGPGGFLFVPAAEVSIDRIVLDTAYHATGLSESEKHRLVLGTYRVKPMNVLPVNEGPDTARAYRFKALLRYDPFSKRWIFLNADYGLLSQTGWASEHIQ